MIEIIAVEIVDHLLQSARADEGIEMLVVEQQARARAGLVAVIAPDRALAAGGIVGCQFFTSQQYDLVVPSSSPRPQDGG